MSDRARKQLRWQHPRPRLSLRVWKVTSPSSPAWASWPGKGKIWEQLPQAWKLR